jgi:hypothetical protein
MLWHRDGFSILGIVLIVQGLVLSIRLENQKDRDFYSINLRAFISYIFGFILLWVARPYVLGIIEPFLKLFFCLLFSSLLIKAFIREISRQKILLVLLSMLLVVFTLKRTKMDIGPAQFRENGTVSDNIEEEMEREEYKAEELSRMTVTAQPAFEKPSVKEATPIVAVKGGVHQEIGKPKTKKIKTKNKKLIKKYYAEDHWKRSLWLPLSIDNRAYYLAKVRRGSRGAVPEAKSNIDHDIGFGSVKDMLIYIPRAIQIAFLSPFPNQWLREGSHPASTLMRKISAFEMIIVYFALIFLPYAIWHWRKRIEIWIIFIFCTYMMLILGLVICNIGTLYRMRYVYITVLAGLGIAGFMAFLENLKIKKDITK